MTPLPTLLRCAAAVLLSLAPAAGLAGGPPPQAQAKAYLEELWRSTGTPGISVAVAVEGKLVFSEGVGFADLDNMVPATGSTVYNVGSVSKAMTAVAIMQLVEQGKVSLEEPIQKYVPAFPDKGSPITIRHIMTHTSGVRHYRDTDFPGSEDNENMKPVASLEEGIRIFKDDPLLFKPGEYYSYSSYAVNLLQGVVERASGMAFEEYMRQHVWAPAGMMSTAFDIPERIVPHRARSYRVDDGRIRNHPYGDLTYKFAGGGMISTAEDLVRLGAALNRRALLKADTLAFMYKPINPIMQYEGKEPLQKPEALQGLIWRILKDPSGRTFANHCGSVKGFRACLVNYTDEDLVVAILGNGDAAAPARQEAVAIAQFFLPQPAQQQQAPESPR